MEGRADLHMHTIHSDGTLTPPELVKRGKSAGLTTISITDHDNVGGINEAKTIGDELGLEVIAGVELSAAVDDQDVHILAYFIDIKNQDLLDHLAFFRYERKKRAERIVGKLNNLKVPLKLESVLEQAGSGSVGRPHIANALLEEGLTETYNEAFFKYIGFGRPAYEKKYQVSPQAAVKLISSAGGLSFIAHPGNSLDEGVILELINEGVDGIEVIHPSHSPDRTAYFNGIVNEYFLLASGGSDFHGGKKNDHEAFGKYYITDVQVDMMRRRLQRR
jgi:predicted metal-dependent phosphoesterase TrpH